MATFVYSALESTAEEVVGLCCQGLAGFDAFGSRSRDGAAKFYDEDCILSPCALDSAWHLGTLTLLGSKVFYGATICLYNNDNHWAMTSSLISLAQTFSKSIFFLALLFGYYSALQATLIGTVQHVHLTEEA